MVANQVFLDRSATTDVVITVQEGIHSVMTRQGNVSRDVATGHMESNVIRHVQVTVGCVPPAHGAKSVTMATTVRGV